MFPAIEKDPLTAINDDNDDFSGPGTYNTTNIEWLLVNLLGGIVH